MNKEQPVSILTGCFGGRSICMINIKKGAVIGCGMVGSATAFALMQKGLFSELVLIDAKKEKAQGEAMDLQTVCLTALPWIFTREITVIWQTAPWPL